MRERERVSERVREKEREREKEKELGEMKVGNVQLLALADCQVDPVYKLIHCNWLIR